eukprot:TRINITY_DN4783_c0_g2_i1.p1 TRINITY_DN4783_c0_g2~~TRINITY_DN4783_c0_g2_i1.p1  ORF type:complete len:262 (-),score=40.87 TRINITY_DN4783_c0_g2_i1:245-1030(-)
MGGRSSKKTTPVQHCDLVPSAPLTKDRRDEWIHNSSSPVPENTLKNKPDDRRRPSTLEIMLQHQEQDSEPESPGTPPYVLHRELSADTCDASQAADQLAQPIVDFDNGGLSWPSTTGYLHHGSGSNRGDNPSLKTRQTQAWSSAPPRSGSRRPSLSAMLGLKIDTTKDPVSNFAKQRNEASPKVSPKHVRRPSTSSAGSASADLDAMTSVVAAANMTKQAVGRAGSSSPRTRRLSFQDVSSIGNIDKAAILKRRPSVQFDF